MTATTLVVIVRESGRSSKPAPKAMRLEGWMRHMDSRPFFETRAPDSARALPEDALLRMRSEIYFTPPSRHDGRGFRSQRSRHFLRHATPRARSHPFRY
jgi:hypothetical protein